MYFYGNGLVSQYTEDSGTEYYHYNNIGSTVYLTKNGVKTHEFAYSTYGELTKGEYGEVRFMYNGRLGVVTDSSGLYYMRARYYNPEIRRFINQDVVTGSIKNSQSLNRYAYCQGNPVNYLDPFGLSPQSFGSWVGHTVLNLLSFVPVFGNAADAFNAVWYAYEGNYAEAIACAVGAIPLIGNLATGFKIGSKVVKGCNIAANGGKAAIGFYNGVQNVMNIDRMIRTGTGRWYDYLGQGVQFGLNMFVSAVGVSGAWNGISNLVGELNQGKVVNRAKVVSGSEGISNNSLTIMSRNSGHGNPNAIIHFGAELNKRQSRLLSQLPSYDSSIIVKKSDVNLNDLSALTAKTGDEFAMFTRGSQRLIIRGGPTSVNIDGVRAQELFEAGYKWSGHTHPGTGYNVKISSVGDNYILSIFKQAQSVIYDSKGRFEIFGGN